MTTPEHTDVRDHLIRGSEYLEQVPNFELVGREQELRKLTAILMRRSANNVLLVGPGGVGCSAICRGLQASKADPDSPYDIVSKRFYWLDSDGLFSSGDPGQINASFQKSLRRLGRSPETVLVLDDMRDFIDAARNSGSTHLINALMRSVRKQRFQVILETRDEDLEVVLKCHSDMRESYTLLDIREPEPEVLQRIVKATAERQLTPHHRIRIADDAIDTAIDVTSKYRVHDLSLSRAQPERSLTLLDRALTTYRLDAHARDPQVAALEERLRAARAGQQPGATSADADALAAQIEALDGQWQERQSEIKRLYGEMRDGEEAVRDLEDELEALIEAEEGRNRQAAQEGADSEDEARKSFLSFGARASAGGYHSEPVQKLQQQIRRFETEIAGHRQAYEALTRAINEQLELGREHVLAEFSSISGIPVSKLTEDERAKLKHLDENLSSRVYGQDEAVTRLANQVRVARAGLQTPNRPQAAFMFLGPSGVGKTELAKALAEELYDERALLRFDMSEYMEKHAVAKLIGAPPGYEGYEAGGILTNEMRRNPRRVLLFDEIEKAHADIFNVFLQILDDARLTDNRGLTVSFRDAMILMTTNIGTQHFLGIDDFEEARALALEDLEAQYRPEFLARFNGKRNIVCFRPLDLAIIERIAARDIQRLDGLVRVTSPELHIEMDAAAISAMCRDHYVPVSGARGITGYIEGVIKPEIAGTVLFTPQARGTIRLQYDESARAVVVQPPSVE